MSTHLSLILVHVPCASLPSVSLFMCLHSHSRRFLSQIPSFSLTVHIVTWKWPRWLWLLKLRNVVCYHYNAVWHAKKEKKEKKKKKRKLAFIQPSKSINFKFVFRYAWQKLKRPLVSIWRKSGNSLEEDTEDPNKYINVDKTVNKRRRIIGTDAQLIVWQIISATAQAT